MSASMLAIGLALFPARASAETPYEAYVAAIEEARKTTVTLEQHSREVEAQREKLRGYREDSLEYQNERRRLQTMMTIEAQIANRLKADRTKLATTGKAWRDSEAGKDALAKKALRTIDVIWKMGVGADPETVRRAVETIAQDLPLVHSQPLNEFASLLDSVEEMAKTGKPLEVIGNEIQSKAKDHPNLGKLPNVLFGALQKLADSQADKRLPRQGLFKAVTDSTGKLGRAVKLLRLIQGKRGDALSSQEFERIGSILELTTDWLPQELAVFNSYFTSLKLMVDAMHERWKVVLLLEAEHNLQRLTAIATMPGARRAGTEWGLDERTLFGRVPPAPKLTLDKTRYYRAEPMVVDFEASHRWLRLTDAGSWMGIVPAEVAHGSSDMADQHDLASWYLDREVGRHSAFRAPDLPGTYEVRLFDSDPGPGEGDGREVASVRFEVEEPGKPTLSLKKFRFAPLEPIQVTVRAYPGRESHVTVYLLKPGLPRTFQSHQLDGMSLRAEALRLVREAEVTLVAPVDEGPFEVRLVEHTGAGARTAGFETLALRTFRVDRSEPFRPVDLSGSWKGIYPMPGGSILEVVEITQTQDRVTATKIVGDQFVPAGKVTFRASLRNLLGVGQVAEVGFRNPSFVDGRLEVFSPDTIAFHWGTSKVIFDRITEAEARRLVNAQNGDGR